MKQTLLISVLITFIFLVHLSANAQLSESFETALVPTDTTPVGWSQGVISGTNGWPNGFKRAGAGSIQAFGAYPAIAAFSGNNVVKFNNRTSNYPAATGAVANDEAVLASRPLDWSGRTPGSSGTISMRFYRDASTTNGVQFAADSIQVYLNNSATMLGADLLTEIATNSTQIPRSTALPPVNPVGWQLLNYAVPTTGFLAGKYDTASTVYVLILAHCAGGNNMFLDSVRAPEWAIPMTVTHAILFYQNTSTVSPGSTDNVVIGLKLVTKGSLAPVKKIGRIKFFSSGSTNFLNDVQAARLYYTHDTASWAANAIQLPAATGTTLPDLEFGYFTAIYPGCGAAPSPPASMKLKPGTENYLWLVYDLKPGAQSGNYVDADVAVVQDTICPAVKSCIPNTLPGGLLVDASYTTPVYTRGTNNPTFWFFTFPNDFISAVDIVGDNGTMIDNWYHDVPVANPPCTQNCDRYSAHPPDYKLFPALNNGLHRNRLIQFSVSQGIRSSLIGPPKSVPYTLRAAAGRYAYPYMKVFIDWNKDGDFDDVFYKTTGAPDSIREDYGQLSLGAANLASPWSGSFGTWTINVPDKTDGVKDRVKAGSNNPLFIGTVRLRVREVGASLFFFFPIPGTPGNFSATSTGYVGETEDYTIQLMDNCPEPNSNICKWIGNTIQWKDPINWCPAIPTKDDIAFIPATGGNAYNFPTIDSGTVATCRTLKIEDGAFVKIDCPVNGSLTVHDSLIIGINTISSTSQLRVNSNFRDQITIPGASVAPPSGNGLAPQSPFRNTASAKLQIAYTASELYNLYGLKSGDVIDDLVFKIKTITPSVGLGTWNNFRIAYWNSPYQKSWGTPLPAGVDTAAYTTTNAIFGGYILGSANSGVTINLNLTNSGLDSVIIPLNPGSFVWDGVSNIILSFEYWTNATLGQTIPAKNYILYCESSPVNNVLSLSYGTINTTPPLIPTICGWTLTGLGKAITVANGGIIAAVSNQRPRIGFIYHRPYTRFPITVGHAFVNNNPNGAPPGNAGFVEGNSIVIFDANKRTLPNSPGLTGVNEWNPTPQPVTLPMDTLLISTGINPQASGTFTIGTAQTHFNELELRTVYSGPGSILKSRLDASVDSLTLTSGEFNLNSKTLTIRNPDRSALNFSNGWIKSEDIGGVFTGFLLWKIGTNQSLHEVPFGLDSANVFPLKLNTINGTYGDVSFATYGTGSSNNTPWPVAPIQVTTMNTNPSPVVDGTPWTVDRFWYIKRSTLGGVLNNDLTLSYPDLIDGTLSAAYDSGFMKIQRYSKSTVSPFNWGWNDPTWFGSHSDIISLNNVVSVTASGNDYLGLNSDSGYIWTVVNLNNGNGPLPVDLINFNAEQVDKKVKTWWDVQSESAVAKYSVERTKDFNFMDVIAQQLPKGPSNSLLHYEAWDNFPLPGMQYYRLRTTSVDGSEQLSQFVPVNFNSKGEFQIIGVNAVSETGRVAVEFYYSGNDAYTYLVTEISGHIVAKGNAVAVPGINRIEIPAQLASGLYLFSIQTQSQIRTAKFKY